MFEDKVKVFIVDSNKEGYIVRVNGVKYDVYVPEDNKIYLLYREQFTLINQ